MVASRAYARTSRSVTTRFVGFSDMERGLLPLSPRPRMTALGTTWTRLALLGGARARTEPELCEAALEGDAAAWDALFRLHQRRVLVALLARGVRVDRARDLCQDAWARLIVQQRAGRLRNLTLPGLAIRQALFLAAEENRRARSRRPHLPVHEVEPPADATTFERIVDRDRLARARVVLEGCPPTARRVFERLYAEPGVRHAEVAEELGLSVQRVRQIVCEVRKTLRAALEEGS